MVSKKFLAGIAALVCAANVHALPMSLTKNVAAGDLLVSGTGKTFEINVNDLLAGNSLSSSSISLGQLTVFGHSDAVYQSHLTTSATTSSPAPAPISMRGLATMAFAA